MSGIKYPPAIREFSQIGLICPASGFDDYKTIKLIIRYLKQRKYKVKAGNSLINSGNAYNYLSGPDIKRRQDFLNFWNDESINAIFCLRGGYGSLRLLREIDFRKLSQRKKIFVGFSDITALLLAVYAKCNLITFHGPMFGYKFLNRNLRVVHKQTETFFWSLLQNPKFNFHYDFGSSGIVLSNGMVDGELVGGNLSEICSLLGTPYLPPFNNKILFLEDCNEKPYKIDRLLTQLTNSIYFNNVKGLIFGNFFNCGFKTHNEIIKLLKDRLSYFNMPVIYNFPIGHAKINYILPIGKRVILDSFHHRLYSV